MSVSITLGKDCYVESIENNFSKIYSNDGLMAKCGNVTIRCCPAEGKIDPFASYKSGYSLNVSCSPSSYEVKWVEDCKSDCNNVLTCKRGKQVEATSGTSCCSIDITCCSTYDA